VSRLDAVETWVDNPPLWTRRAALVPDEGRARPRAELGRAARLADDREWFIQKAVNWWLRELSECDPERVRRFLEEYGRKLTGAAKREATKYLER
jgi:3-methyladenine DNA glycosylase AlkD